MPAEPHASALGQARIVAADQRVSLGSVRYSVPPNLQGARVWVAVQGQVVIRADARRLAVVPEWAQADPIDKNTWPTSNPLVVPGVHGVKRIESKMRAIVDLAALRAASWPAKPSKRPCGPAGTAGVDVTSIADFIATTGSLHDMPVHAGEHASTQPGTGGPAGFTTATSSEVAR